MIELKQEEKQNLYMLQVETKQTYIFISFLYMPPAELLLTT